MATAGIKEIKISNTNYLIEPTVYTTTKESAATATYTADLTNFQLFNGVVVTVRFATTNNANATLNINSTGAKPIYYNGAKLTASKLPALHLYPLVYDTSVDTDGGWRLVGDLDTNLVTGVKGNSESNYRTGNVNITKSNIGLSNVENTKLSTWTGSANITTIGTLSNGTVPWARLSDIPAASTSAAGIIQIGTGATNAAAGDHNHNGTYVKVAGGDTMTGALTFTSQSSAFNNSNILFSSGGRIGGNTAGDIGIYAKGTLYIKPNSNTAASADDGVVLDTDGLRPYKNNDYSLGTSANEWSAVYTPLLAAGSDSLTIRVGTASTTFTVAKFEGSAFLPGTTSARYIGSTTNLWANTYSQIFTAGSRVSSTTPSSEQSVDRIIITPYFHTDGPWKITSADDSAYAYLKLMYGSNEALKIRSDGALKNLWSLGVITAENGTISHMCDAGGGTAGYFKFATIVVKSTYSNRGMQISYVGRGRTGGTIYLYFSNQNGVDPTLTVTSTGDGTIYYQKSATSTWDLYINKSEGYDNEYFSILNPGEITRGLTWTWKNEIITTLPENYITASIHTLKLNLDGNAATADYLTTIDVTNSTIDSTAGSFAFKGSGNPWANTDWVGLQIGSNNDKWQLVAGGSGSNSLLFRQNDSGGTNTTWQPWHNIAHAATGNAIGGTKQPVYMAADGTITAGTALKNLAYKDSLAANDIPDISGTYLPLSGGTMSGQISHAGMASTWRAGRDNAMIAITTANAYSPLASVKTENGSWELGTYKVTSNTSYVDRFLFTYFADTTYNASSNNNSVSSQLMITSEGSLYPFAGTNPSLGTSNYRWDNGYYNSHLYVGPTTYTAYNSNETGTYIEPGGIGLSNKTAQRGYYLRGGTAQYAHMFIHTIGTASTAESSEGADDGKPGTLGNAVLELGNNIAYVPKNTAGGAHNARGLIRFYGNDTAYTQMVSNLKGNTNHNFWLPDYAGEQYAVHVGNTSAVGSTTRPVYIAANGRATQTSYGMAGTNITASTSVAYDSDLATGIWYVGNIASADRPTLYNQTDGVIIANQYNDKWITEIYQDYRTGRLAVRGKNNGTWADWTRILDTNGGQITGNLELISADTAITSTANKRIQWTTTGASPVVTGYITVSSPDSNRGKLGIHATGDLYFRPGNASNVISSETGTVMTNTSFYPYSASESMSLGISTRPWNGIYSNGGVFSGDVVSNDDLTHTIGTLTTRWGGVHSGYLWLSGPASDPSNSAGARIIFSYDGSTTNHNSQPVILAYSPNDSYRAPYGLKLFGTDGNSSGAWLEVQGNIYAAAFKGNADTATTASFIGKGSHTAAITANEFTPAVGTLTILGNVSNTSMPNKTNNANAEVIVKAHPTSETNYYEARLGFNSNGNLYHMPVNGNSWKTILDSSNYTSYAVAKTGSTMSGELTLSKANGGSNFGVYVEHTNPNSDTTKSKKIALMIGGSSGSGGLYDVSQGKWIVYSDTNGNVTLNGKATTATGVSQDTSTTASYRKILLSGGDAYTAWNTSATARTGNLYQATSISVQPSTGTILANKYIAESTDDASSTSTGTLIVNGGVGIAKKLYVGTESHFAGAIYTANNTWNQMGDDAYFGDINKAGHIGIQGKNGNTGIFFTTYNQTTKTTGAALTWDGTNMTFDKAVKLPNDPTADLEAATKQYVDNKVSAGFAANDAMVYKGILNKDATETATTLKNVPASGYSAGWTYKVAVAGTYANVSCEVGDMVIAVTDAAANQSAVNNSHWTVVQANLVGAVVADSGESGYIAKFSGPNTITKGPKIGTSTTTWLNETGAWSTPTAANVGAVAKLSSSTDNAIVRFDGSAGAIQDSNVTIDDNGCMTFTHVAGKSSEIRVKYSSTIDYWWGVGSGNENHGLYDTKLSKWIISAGTDNKWSFDGNANTATTAASLAGGLATNDVSTYTNLKVTTAKGGYYGFLVGDSTSCMNIMGASQHNGLYCQAKGRWILYYDATNDRATIGSATTKSGYILHVHGNEYVTGNIYSTGSITTIGTINVSPGGSGEGGQIQLNAGAEATTKAGIILDNCNSNFRIFGIQSADGTTKTGTGTPLVIDPYAKTITGGYTITGTLSGNASSASKVSATLVTNKKIYFLGTETAITSTAANVSLEGDTGVYMTTTAGELSAVRHSYNVNGTEKAYTTYNTTDDSIDFIFI